MRLKFLIIALAGLFMCAPRLAAQPDLERQLKGYTAPDELVSLSANLSFTSAVDLLNKVSIKKTGRKIISLVKRDNPIGVEIINVQYEKALLMIVQYAGLVYEKTEEATIIKTKIDTKTEIKPETYADVEAREVRISAIFFEMNTTELKNRGLNWQFLLNNKSGGITAGSTTTSAAGSSTSSGTSGTTSSNVSADFTVSGNTDFGAGGFFGQVSSLFRYFESQNLGEVIASPSVVVRNRSKGKLQVGSDFSIKQRDFAGNLIENFLSTGSIVEVTPYIYEQDSIQYILLDLDAQRSSGFPSELTTEVRKSSAKTQILMLDGEQTVIGGLYQNEETKVRAGIPILKDLPWWVLGIRYLTGSDSYTLIKKELVIVIKVDLLPRLRDRLRKMENTNVVKKSLQEMRDNMKIYNLNSIENNGQSTELPKDK